MQLMILLQQQGLLLRSDKIGSVLAVIAVIFIGLVVFLLLTGKKISKLEKELEELKRRKGM
jgi:CcmD family protein